MTDQPAVNVESAAEARRLLELWQNLSRQHVSLAGNCACGAGGVTLRLEDFEQDIADYLLGEAERNKRSEVISFLRRTHSSRSRSCGVCRTCSMRWRTKTAPSGRRRMSAPAC